MAFGTVIQQGRFTSTGAAVNLDIRSDLDWLWVYNETVLHAGGNGDGAQFYWQRGMANGRGVVYNKLAADDSLQPAQIAANAGFFLVDSSIQAPLARVAETAITNAVQPVVSTGNTGSLATGSIVRLENDTNLPNLMGFEYEVDNVVANTSFRMRWALSDAPGAAGAGDGFYRHIEFDPIYYPRRRYIVNITQANPAVVRTSVTHGYTVGQEIRFKVPVHFHMVEMDGLVGTITAVDTANNTFTVDIDASAFTTYNFPEVADVPFEWAQAVPFGEDTAEALSAGVDILGGATNNQAILGMRLAAGANSPAGENNDVIYWVAGKSFSVDNQ